MPEDKKFMYGTHYSTPGYVVGYLFRKNPLWMLHLQSGKFDAPDRLFYDVQKDWKNCYSHNGCLKELIPEFYMTDTDFLINKKFLDFGKTQMGEDVSDVRLPKWAKSAKDFL